MTIVRYDIREIAEKIHVDASRIKVKLILTEGVNVAFDGPANSIRDLLLRMEAAIGKEHVTDVVIQAIADMHPDRHPPHSDPGTPVVRFPE